MPAFQPSPNGPRASFCILRWTAGILPVNYKLERGHLARLKQVTANMLDNINLLAFFEQFILPNKRLFVGYLLAAAFIALLFLTYKIKSLTGAFRKLIADHPFWTRSNLADYRLAVFNFFFLSAIGSFLLTSVAVATFVFNFLNTHTDARLVFYSLETPLWLPLLYTATFFIVDDFARFFLHYLMHKFPLLWAFHKVHHSAQVLTPFTVLRTHPVEGILFSIRGSLVQGLCIASFVFAFGNQFSLVTVLGSNIFVFAFNVLGANLRHSHVYLRYFPWLEKWLISPAQHQIHHSVETRHFDKNMGVILAVWDRLFGTLHISDPQPPKAVGLSETMKQDSHSVKATLLDSFTEAWRTIRRGMS